MSLKHEQTLQKRIDLEGWGSRVDYLEDTAESSIHCMAGLQDPWLKTNFCFTQLRYAETIHSD